MNADRTAPTPRYQRGAGIIETMIGILIGLVVILAIYSIFAVSEGYKRTATGVADAQVTWLFAQFLLGREITNAGNGISSALDELSTCTTTTLKAIPVLITDGGNANTSDSFVVFYGVAKRVLTPVYFQTLMASPTDDFRVQSPNGFNANDQVLAVNPLTGECDAVRATAVGAPDATGTVTISHAATSAMYTEDSKLINLGPVTNAARTLFSVVADQLHSTALKGPALAAPDPSNPLAQNIVLMKAQYGVDSDNDGDVDSWTAATGGYAVATVLGFTASQISTIKAIRLAIVVRSDEPDLKDAALTGQSAVLFNCSANTDAGCPGRLTLDDTSLRDNYRYRIYETVVPMRNAIWNNIP